MTVAATLGNVGSGVGAVTCSSEPPNSPETSWKVSRWPASSSSMVTISCVGSTFAAGSNTAVIDFTASAVRWKASQDGSPVRPSASSSRTTVAMHAV